MTNARDTDIDWLKNLPDDQLLDLFFVHIRDMWAVDGLYFLGIESRFGTESAVEIDSEVWKILAKIELKRLLEVFKVDKSRPFESFMTLIKASGWWLDLEDKTMEYIPDQKKLICTNHKCRVQLTRLKKGLSEFNCKPVRLGYIEAFAKTYNPNIKVNCITCPPDEHPEDLWCKWELIMIEK